MAAIADEYDDLEAMRKEDSSWHPCRASLSSKNDKIGIVVAFEKCSEEETIYNKEEAILRLRYRSSPLQDGQCLYLKEGECIMALHKSQYKSLYFDAVIGKFCRVKHSARVFCRCTFEISWKNSELTGRTETVPSSAIKKLSDKEFESHPIFAAFINSSHQSNSSEIPSYLSLVEETNYDSGIHDLLEKQIEEISSLADGSKAYLGDFILKVGVGTGKSKSDKKVIRDMKSVDSIKKSRTTRSGSKQKVEEILKLQPEINKPCLPPLAARAALALWVREIPRESNLHINQAETSILQSSAAASPKKLLVGIQSSGVTFGQGESMLDLSSYLSGQCHSTPLTTPPERTCVTKRSRTSETPREASIKTEEYHLNSSLTEVSAAAGKQNSPNFTPRITRSAARKEESSHTDGPARSDAEISGMEPEDEVFGMNPPARDNNNKKAVSPLKTQRKMSKEKVTRSSGSAAAVQKGGRNNRFGVDTNPTGLRSSPRIRMLRNSPA